MAVKLDERHIAEQMVSRQIVQQRLVSTVTTIGCLAYHSQTVKRSKVVATTSLSLDATSTPCMMRSLHFLMNYPSVIITSKNCGSMRLRQVKTADTVAANITCWKAPQPSTAMLLSRLWHRSCAIPAQRNRGLELELVVHFADHRAALDPTSTGGGGAQLEVN